MNPHNLNNPWYMNGGAPVQPEVTVRVSSAGSQPSQSGSIDNVSDVMHMRSASQSGGVVPMYRMPATQIVPVAYMQRTYMQQPSQIGSQDMSMSESDLARIMADPNVPPHQKEKLMQRMFSLGQTDAERATGDKQQVVKQEWLEREALQGKLGQKVVSDIKHKTVDIHAEAKSQQERELRDSYMHARVGRQEHLLALRDKLGAQMSKLRNEIDALKAGREDDMAEAKRLELVAQREQTELKNIQLELCEAREEIKRCESKAQRARRDMPTGIAAAFNMGKKSKIQFELDDAESSLGPAKAKERHLESKVEEQKETERRAHEAAASLLAKHSTGSYNKLSNELMALQAEFNTNENNINKAFRAAHNLMEKDIEAYE
ncbi:hypothetical protein FVE85_7468 [Porphyridium purpureum]|uniref:Uncharacterized protein n=1 Tax=Porphyridium purpureum TaxID=35688 RepID=A0A5J4ZAW4_PORPP|nr:hypothetical protein FVE85_7468 [Porphyridium purpureum]|eukprot:POR9567..scf295_1